MVLSDTVIISLTAVTGLLSFIGVGLSAFSVYCLLKVIRHLPDNLRILTVSLFTADIVLFVSLPGLCYIQLTHNVEQGKTLCTVLLLLLSFGASAQFQHHALISLDRYLAVSQPLRYISLVTRRRLAIAIAFSWTISLLIGATITLGKPVGPVNVCSGLVSTIPASVGLCVYGISGITITFSYVLTFRIARRHHMDMSHIKKHFKTSDPVSLTCGSFSSVRRYGVWFTSYVQVSEDKSQGGDRDNPRLDPDGEMLLCDDAEKRSCDDINDDDEKARPWPSVSTQSSIFYEDMHDPRLMPTTAHEKWTPVHHQYDTDGKKDKTYETLTKPFVQTASNTVNSIGSCMNSYVNNRHGTNNNDQNEISHIYHPICSREGQSSSHCGVVFKDDFYKENAVFGSTCARARLTRSTLKNDVGIHTHTQFEIRHCEQEITVTCPTGGITKSERFSKAAPNAYVGTHFEGDPTHFTPSDKDTLVTETHLTDHAPAEQRHLNPVSKGPRAPDGCSGPAYSRARAYYDRHRLEDVLLPGNFSVNLDQSNRSSNLHHKTTISREKSRFSAEDLLAKHTRLNTPVNSLFASGINSDSTNHTECSIVRNNRSLTHVTIQDGHYTSSAATGEVSASDNGDPQPGTVATPCNTADASDASLQASHQIDDTSFRDALRSTKVNAIIICYYVLSWVPPFILGMGTKRFNGVSPDATRILLGLGPALVTMTGLGHSLLYFGIQRRVRRVVKRRLCVRRENARRWAESFTFW